MMKCMTAYGVGVLLVVLATLLAVVSLSTCQQAVFPKPQGNPGQPVERPSEDADSDHPTVSITDANAMESAGHVSLAVTLSSSSVTTVTAGYATESGTAREGEDFVATNGTLTFSPGSVGQTIAIPIRPDDTDEADRESFMVRLDSVENATLGDAVATATILDDDLTVGVAVAAPSTVVEGGVARFAVTVTGGRSSSPVEVVYHVAGTAHPGADYAAPSGRLTLAAGTATGTIAIHTVADEVLDPGETIQVRLRSATTMPGAVTVNPAKAQANATIADPGMVTIAVMAVSQAVEEGDDAKFGVTLTSPVASAVTLRWTTADGTATAGADYAAVIEGLVTFSPGSTAQTILVATLQDNLDEADESFSVTLLQPHLAEAVTLGTATATVVIADDDHPPLLRIADVTVVEGTTAQFAVTLGAPSSRRASVAYATSDGTAEQPADYAAASNVLTFAAGETVKTIGVLTNNDVLDEPDWETFVVTLSDPVHVTLSGGANTLQATGTVVDDDDPPVLRITDATASEGEEAEFVVTLDAASALPVTVAYATGDGTAQAPADYTAVSRTELPFAGGTRTKTVTVATMEDTRHEPRETFVVTLSNAVNATLAGGGSTLQAMGTIMDNDKPPVLRITDSTASEGEAAEFVVTLDAASALPVTVAYATSSVSAEQPVDYAAASGSLTLAAGERSQTIAVLTRDDGLDEADRETFVVTLSNAVNATLAGGGSTLQAMGTIMDNDKPPVLRITDSTASEGEAAEFVVTLDAASALPVTVAYATSSVSAEQPVDYAAASGSLTLAAGERSQTIAVLTRDDGLDEADRETFVVTLSNAVNATLAGGGSTLQAMGTIMDNDKPPVLRITDSTASEGEAAEFVVTLDAASALPVTVAYATSSVSAEQPVDYAAASGSLTLAAGERSQTIAVLTRDDGLDEADRETFVVTLSNAVNATLAGGGSTLQAMGTIMDNDKPPVLRITDSTASEGEAAEFVVTLDAASALPVTVAYATSSVSAEQPVDYAAASGSLTLAAGERSQTIAVLTRDDGLDEADRETFVVTLSNAVNATLAGGGSTLQAMGTIMDNDKPPVLRITDSTASEGEAAEFVVTLDAASALPVTVAYATGDGTARAGEDYTPVPGGTLTFAGDTEQTISVATTQDTRNEDRESFTVMLSSPSNATLVAGAATATGTIIDDDALPVLSLAGTTVSEGQTAEFVVTLRPASGRPVTVAYRTADGTARAGQDYTAVSRMALTFVAGATLQTIRIATTQDTRNEGDERFTVTLSSPSNATLTGGAATATGVITDDDDGDDHGNTRSAATAIQPGTPISGRLETATDVDYFKVAVSASSTLVAATDAAKAADRQHHEYRDTVVRIEGFGYFSSNADSFDTAEITVGVPGTYDIFVRVTGAHASRYDLAVWLTNPEALDSSFDIALRFLGTEPTPAQKRTIRAAARVWERVITRGLPDRPVVSSDEACEDSDPSLFGELIDDLLINVRLQAIDGPRGVLAAAGPCWIRSTDGLPYLGDVLFDTADLAYLELHDALGGTVAHEFAHVLGFGLLWGDSLKEPSLGPSGNRIAGQDTHFAGRQAVANFNAAGGATYGGAKVPVENDTAEYGIGALDAHWRESVFGAELMTTSVVIADPAEPLSAVTIASLADIGYEVDYSQAQSYLLPTALSSRKAGPGAIRLIQLHNDIRRKPIRVANPPELPNPVVVR